MRPGKIKWYVLFFNQTDRYWFQHVSGYTLKCGSKRYIINNMSDIFFNKGRYTGKQRFFILIFNFTEEKKSEHNNLPHKAVW